MNTDKTGYCNSLTERILAAIFEISNTLGAGFLEKFYERALLHELTFRRIPATAQASFTVTYKGHLVGEYFADILVDNLVVIEVKCVHRLAPSHAAQGINYLRASGLRLCLLVNFQSPKVDWKRIMHGFDLPESPVTPLPPE